MHPIPFDPDFSTHDKNRWKRGEDEMKRPDRPNAYLLTQCIRRITAGDKHTKDAKTKPISLPDIKHAQEQEKRNESAPASEKNGLTSNRCGISTFPV